MIILYPLIILLLTTPSLEGMLRLSPRAAEKAILHQSILATQPTFNPATNQPHTHPLTHQHAPGNNQGHHQWQSGKQHHQQNRQQSSSKNHPHQEGLIALGGFTGMVVGQLLFLELIKEEPIDLQLNNELKKVIFLILFNQLPTPSNNQNFNYTTIDDDQLKLITGIDLALVRTQLNKLDPEEACACISDLYNFYCNKCNQMLQGQKIFISLVPIPSRIFLQIPALSTVFYTALMQLIVQADTHGVQVDYDSRFFSNPESAFYTFTPFQKKSILLKLHEITSNNKKGERCTCPCCSNPLLGLVCLGPNDDKNE